MDDLLLKIFRYFNNWKRSKLADIFLQRSRRQTLFAPPCIVSDSMIETAFETVLASWQVEIVHRCY